MNELLFNYFSVIPNQHSKLIAYIVIIPVDILRQNLALRISFVNLKENTNTCLLLNIIMSSLIRTCT